MNRVLLCGACVAAVRCLLGEKCARVQVVTASDGSLTTRVSVSHWETDGDTAFAVIDHGGEHYRAEARWDEDPGVTLQDDNLSQFLKETPALVYLLMQNIGLQLDTEGVIVSVSVKKEED